MGSKARAERCRTHEQASDKEANDWTDIYMSLQHAHSCGSLHSFLRFRGGLVPLGLRACEPLRFPLPLHHASWFWSRFVWLGGLVVVIVVVVIIVIVVIVVIVVIIIIAYLLNEFLKSLKNH